MPSVSEPNPPRLENVSSAWSEEPSILESDQTRWKQRTRRRIVTVCILLVGAILVWRCVEEKPWYHFIPKRFGTVVPGKIYRSGQISGSLIEEVIVKYDLGRIICLCGYDVQNPHHVAERKAAWKHKLPYSQFALSGDGTGSIGQYASAIQILNMEKRKGTPVLIHCEAGSSRTGVAVAYYRYFIEEEEPELIYNELVDYGFDASPNNRSLRYLNDNLERMGELLVELDVIERMPETFPRIGPPVETRASR